MPEQKAQSISDLIASYFTHTKSNDQDVILAAKIEELFSDEHLMKDVQMLIEIKKHNGTFVSLSFLVSHEEVRKLNTDKQKLCNALQVHSKLLELNKDGSMVRRIEPVTDIALEPLVARSLLVENLPELLASSQTLTSLFSHFGSIVAVNVYHPQQPKKLPGAMFGIGQITTGPQTPHAIVLFESQEDADKTVKLMKEENDKRFGLIVNKLPAPRLPILNNSGKKFVRMVLLLKEDGRIGVELNMVQGQVGTGVFVSGAANVISPRNPITSPKMPLSPQMLPASTQQPRSEPQKLSSMAHTAPPFTPSLKPLAPQASPFIPQQNMLAQAMNQFGVDTRPIMNTNMNNYAGGGRNTGAFITPRANPVINDALNLQMMLQAKQQQPQPYQQQINQSLSVRPSLLPQSLSGGSPTLMSKFQPQPQQMNLASAQLPQFQTQLSSSLMSGISSNALSSGSIAPFQPQLSTTSFTSSASPFKPSQLQSQLSSSNLSGFSPPPPPIHQPSLQLQNSGGLVSTNPHVQPLKLKSSLSWQPTPPQESQTQPQPPTVNSSNLSLLNTVRRSTSVEGVSGSGSGNGTLSNGLGSPTNSIGTLPSGENRPQQVLRNSSSGSQSDGNAFLEMLNAWETATQVERAPSVEVAQQTRNSIPQGFQSVQVRNQRQQSNRNYASWAAATPEMRAAAQSKFSPPQEDRKLSSSELCSWIPSNSQQPIQAPTRPTFASRGDSAETQVRIAKMPDGTRGFSAGRGKAIRMVC